MEAVRMPLRMKPVGFIRGGTRDSPVFGAYLVWRFAQGYARTKVEGPSLLHFFPALSIVLDSSFSAEITRARSLAEFAYAFYDSAGKVAKSLGGLGERIMELRDWVLDSMRVAIATRLVAIEPETARLVPVLRQEKPGTRKLARKFKECEGLRAERLGEVFARTDERDIPYYLGVRY